MSYVDVWLPPDAPLGATDAVTQRAETVIREEAERFGNEHHQKNILKSLTTFVGGGGPRFWFSVDPERQQLNYAQILVEVSDKHFTNHFVGPMQTALSREVPGARVDVRQLETGKPVGIPVSIRISGPEIEVLHRLSGELQTVFRAQPNATRVRDDWGEPAMNVRLKVDPDRANLSGITNLDIALSSAAAESGLPVSTYREADKQIPIAVRLRMEERAGLSDIQNAYVYSLTSNQRVPLRQVSNVTHGNGGIENQTPQSIPDGYGIRVPDSGCFTVSSAHAAAAENQGVPEEPASRLFPRDRRRIRRTAERFQGT